MYNNRHHGASIELLFANLHERKFGGDNNKNNEKGGYDKPTTIINNTVNITIERVCFQDTTEIIKNLSKLEELLLHS